MIRRRSQEVIKGNYSFPSSWVQWRMTPSYSCSNERWKKRVLPDLESLPSSPSDLAESFLALASRSARSFASAAARAGARVMSKYFLPSIQVCSQTVEESSGSLDHITK